MTASPEDDRPGQRESRLLELPSPFPLEPGTVKLLEPATGFGPEQLDRLREGTLGQPFIVDRDGTRNLFFTTAAVQSAMLLDDPHALVAPYTRKMMAFLLFRPVPRHIVMIGLGGGSLAKFCYHRLPRTRITVVEVSAEIIALREEFAIPADDGRFEIVHADGGVFLPTSGLTPDVILIDAFDELGVSPALATSAFYEAASQCLAPDGVLVMNLSGKKTRYPVHIESVRAAFPGPVRLVPVEGEDNMLLFAFGARQQIGLPEFFQRRADCLERALGLEFSRYLGRLRAGEVLTSRGY